MRFIARSQHPEPVSTLVRLLEVLVRAVTLLVALSVGISQSGCSGDLGVLEPPNKVSSAPAQALRPVPPPPGNEEYAAVLFEQIRSRLGSTPAECGRHFRERTARGVSEAGVIELEKSLSCGLAAAHARQSFWTFKQEQGIDSWLAYGLIAGSDGMIQHFIYDSLGVCGAAGCSTLAVAQCDQPLIKVQNGAARFSCANSPF